MKETEIAIIGAGITGLTTAFHLMRHGKTIHLLEQADRTGGQIRTYREDEFTFESGPNTGALSAPEVAELFALLSPACRLETARKESKRRLIWKSGRFHPLPSGLWGGITTPLFTLGDKFYLLGEPFRKKGTDPDESVGALACRRLGKSFLNYAIDPFISGIYAGDPMKLVTRYALPKLYNLEQQYGSFIKGSIAKARQPKTDRDRLATKQVFSVKGGMDQLTEALTRHIESENITLSASGVQIQPAGDRWQINYTTSEGEQTLMAQKVVTTTGAYSLPELLPFIPAAQMEKISRLAYAPIIQVAVGIKDTGKLSFNSFGGLVPSIEKQSVLGILMPSACFLGRAPQKGVILSFFMGGVKHPEILEKTDDQIYTLIEQALSSMLGFPANTIPDLVRIFRHPHAIPQYEKSSGERFEAIRQIETVYPGLTLAGNIIGGIGLPDRIRQGAMIANSLI